MNASTNQPLARGGGSREGRGQGGDQGLPDIEILDSNMTHLIVEMELPKRQEVVRWPSRESNSNWWSSLIQTGALPLCNVFLSFFLVWLVLWPVPI